MTTYAPLADPPVPDNRICVFGGCERMLPDEAVTHGDPFCSSDCCRLYHGQELPVPDGGWRITRSYTAS